MRGDLHYLALLIAASFNNFVVLMLYFLVPWTAVNLVDFYIVRRGKYAISEILNPEGTYGRWAWRGISAYLIGFVAMIPFFATTFYTGPVADALGGADLSFAPMKIQDTPDRVTVAIVQHPPAVLDLKASLERAAQHVADAASQGAQLVTFPETWLLPGLRLRTRSLG
ncbi:cytosine permease [Arthrobacter sp. NPDC058127]|uniref:cytosine permease n=1 Tax=Arthrobacter sp. NPDC058127 TaxID=3346351 RepID=UPI0036F03823